MAILEVCGFNDWLIRMLQDYRCYNVILIQPEDRQKCKTDRRDAAALSELLWVNRARLLAGKPVRGVRQVDIASSTDQENRRLTTLRKEARQARTLRLRDANCASSTLAVRLAGRRMKNGDMTTSHNRAFLIRAGDIDRRVIGISRGSTSHRCQMQIY